MGDAELQITYRAVVVGKLLYAASAWWGFTAAADRQRVEAQPSRSVTGRTLGYVTSQPPAYMLLLLLL